MTTNSNENNKVTSAVTTLPAEQFTDAQLSDIFARDYKNKVRFCHETSCWFVWNEKQWSPDICGEVIGHAEECVKKQIAQYAQTAQTVELKKVLSCLSTGKFRSIVSLAESKMPIKKSEFNANPWLFNCKNGVLNLKTGELIPHSPDQLLSFMANVDFNPDEDCPVFKAFIHQIMLGKEELISYLQRAAGYTLTGDTSEQCFFLLMGDGKNGKTTLLELMRHILGDYARTVGAKTLMISNTEHIPSDIALLEGKRYAPCSETSSMQRLNEARVKALTGGDQIEARRRYADEYNYNPQFKLWVATNSTPTIKGTDEGIWRRIHKIPFELRLESAQVNKRLLDDLKKEVSGVLNWLFEGCKQWQKMGGLMPPDVVKNATAAYRAEMDTVLDFASDCLKKVAGTSILNPQMYATFSKWYYDNVGDNHLPTHKDMTQRLKQAGYNLKGGKSRKWVDVAFREENDWTDAELEDFFAKSEAKPEAVYIAPQSGSLDESLPF